MNTRRRWRSRVGDWARQRQGEDAVPLALVRRRLYVLPTRAGLAFAALLFIMLLAALNYTNSLGLLVTGGSDFHGDNHHGSFGPGSVALPQKHWDLLTADR